MYILIIYPLLSAHISTVSPRPCVFASMISLMRPAPTLFFAASLTLYQVPQRRLSSLKERSLELMKTSFHSSVLSTEYCSTKPAIYTTKGKLTINFCSHFIIKFFLFLTNSLCIDCPTCLTLVLRWPLGGSVRPSASSPARPLIGGWFSCTLSTPPLVTYKPQDWDGAD